jgi:hypothetical protein
LRPDLLRTLIRTFFADYLRLVECDAARKMRLDQITFPRKRFEHGVIAEVPPKKGETVTVIARIEHTREAPRPIAGDLRRLGLRYGQPVLFSVLQLIGGRPFRDARKSIAAPAWRESRRRSSPSHSGRSCAGR